MRRCPQTQRIADLSGQLQVVLEVGAAGGRAKGGGKSLTFSAGPQQLTLIHTRCCKPPTLGGQGEKWEQWYSIQAQGLHGVCLCVGRGVHRAAHSSRGRPKERDPAAGACGGPVHCTDKVLPSAHHAHRRHRPAPRPVRRRPLRRRGLGEALEAMLAFLAAAGLERASQHLSGRLWHG